MNTHDNINNQHHSDDEIDILELIRTLIKDKKFIIGLTGAITLLAILIAFLIPSTYSSSIHFISPSQSSIIQLNKMQIITKSSETDESVETAETAETAETVYGVFLNNMMSKKYHKSVFLDGSYLDRLNLNKDDDFDLDKYIVKFTRSIKIEPGKKVKNERSINYEKPVIITIEGSDPIIISDYLNDLSRTVNKNTVAFLLTKMEKKLAIRREKLVKQREALLSIAKHNRLSEIERIKSADNQKINEISDKIERLRLKATQDRLNKIILLTDAMSIAKELGIVDNNFKSSNGENFDSVINIEIDNNKTPDWYLYGVKALSKEINILEKRTNDDPYIPELTTLQNQLLEIKSNQKLASLISRKDDSPFIKGLGKLDIEINKLKTFNNSSPEDIHAAQVIKPAYEGEAIKPKKIRIVLLAFVAGLFLSILISLIKSALRRQEEDLTQNNDIVTP